MTERVPRTKNLYLLDLDMNLIDSIDYPAEIYDISPEPECPDGEETFLVLSSRDTCLAKIRSVQLDTPLGNSLYALDTVGEEVTGGEIIVRKFVTVNFDGTVSQTARFDFDEDPKVKIETIFTQFPDITVQGPPINEGPIGLLMPTSTGFISNVFLSSQLLEPKWSIARMDLGLTILERCDLGSTAQSICKAGDDYYVLIEPVSPSVAYPQTTGLTISGVTNPSAILTIYYSPAAELCPGISLSANSTNYAGIQYLEPTGGEITIRVSVSTTTQGLFLSTILPPTPVEPGKTPDIAEACRRIGMYLGADFTVKANDSIKFAGVLLGNASVQERLRGGCFERVTPRYSIVRLNKGLKVLERNEWDHDLYTDALDTSGSSNVNQSTLYGRDNIIYLEDSDSFVVSGQSQSVSPKIWHGLLRSTGGDYVGSAAYFRPATGIPYPVLGYTFADFNITFFLGDVPISSALPMANYYDVDNSPYYNLQAIANVYNDYLGPGSCVPDILNNWITFAGAYGLTVVPVPGFIVTAISPLTLFFDQIHNLTQKYSFTFSQGGPAQFGVPSFVEGFNISGRHERTDPFRIRFSRSPGIALSKYTATGSGIQTGLQLRFFTPSLTRTEPFRIRYQGVWSDEIVLTWIGSSLRLELASLTLLRTTLDSITGVTWTQDGTGPSNLVRFKSTSSVDIAELEADSHYEYTEQLTLESSLDDIRDQLTDAGYTNVAFDLDNKAYDGPIRWRSTSSNMGPIAIDLMLGEPNTPKEHYQVFDRAIIERQTYNLASVEPAREKYPRQFKEVTSLPNRTVYTGKIFLNSFGEYYTDGVCRYDKNHNLIQFSELGKIHSVDQHDHIILTPSALECKIYDRTLTLQGTLAAPGADRFLPFATTDQFGNYYVLLTTYRLAKYDSYYRYIGISAELANVGFTTNVNFALGLAPGFVQPVALECVGKYLVLALSR